MMIFEKTIKKIVSFCVGVKILDDTTNPPIPTIQMIIFSIILFLTLWGIIK